MNTPDGTTRETQTEGGETEEEGCGKRQVHLSLGSSVPEASPE